MRSHIIHIITASLVSFPAFAQVTTGVVRGTVVDSVTNEPLAGVNVSVRGTVLGGATDQGGKYVLERVPPGRYTILFSMVGYGRQSVHDVQVNAGGEANIDVRLVETVIRYEQVVVTASRREQRINEVPVSMATVTADEIAQRSNVTLDDALRYVPGVNMIQDQINIRGSSGYSRGVGSRVLLLVDGLPYLTGDTGEINWEVVPVYQIQRIEVVKGAGSALYGSSALGGVVNVITKDIPEGHHGSFRLYSGYYDKPRHGEWIWTSKPRFNSGLLFNYSGRVSDFGYLVGIGRTVDESYRQNDTYHRWNFFAKLQYTLSATQTLTVTGNLLNRTHGNFFWWKSLGDALLPDTPQLNGSVYSNRGNVSIAYNHFFSNDLLMQVKGIYFGNFWRDDSAGLVRNVSTSHVGYGEVQLTYQIEQGNVVTGGIALNRDQVESNLFGRHPGIGFAAFVQDELLLLNALRVTAGLRYDFQKVSVLESAGQLSPKIGLLYTLSPITSLRASAGSGFRYPSIGELFISSSTNVSAIAIVPNTNLKPERSITLEAGVKHTITDFLAVDAAVYHSEFTELIEPSVNPTKLVIEFNNLTRASIQGVELDLQFSVIPKLLKGQAAYTYIWAREKDSLGVEHPLKFRPRHLIHSSLSFTLGGFLAAVEYRYISRMERIDENLAELVIKDGDARVPIHVMDLRISQDFEGFVVPIRLGFNLKNVLNYHYVELMGNMAPFRTYMLSIEGGF